MSRSDRRGAPAAWKILALLLLLHPVAASAGQDDQDILVIARKLRRINVNMKLVKWDGAMVLRRCEVTRASGEAELDAIPCAIAEACVAEGVNTRKQLVACVEDKSNRRINAIIAARRNRDGRGAAEGQ